MALNIIFGLINISILAVIYILLRKRIDRLTEPGRITESLAGDLDIILSEINQATERNILIIEDKIKQLEEVIETAESRITLLKKQAAEERHRPEQAVRGKQKDPGQLALEIPAENEPSTETSELTYSHLNRMNTMSGLVTPLAVPEKKQPEAEELKEQVVSLHRSGIDARIIASKLGINRGEVELIISLYSQPGSSQV